VPGLLRQLVTSRMTINFGGFWGVEAALFWIPFISARAAMLLQQNHTCANKPQFSLATAMKRYTANNRLSTPLFAGRKRLR
jgi:hypothetical protein